MKARFKVVVNKAEAISRNLDFEFKETTDFNEVLAVLGRKTFRRTPNQERAARARIDRDKFFKGVINPYSKADTGRERLEDFVTANDIPGYVAAWRKLNNLTN